MIERSPPHPKLPEGWSIDWEANPEILEYIKQEYGLYGKSVMQLGLERRYDLKDFELFESVMFHAENNEILFCQGNTYMVWEMRRESLTVLEGNFATNEAVMAQMATRDAELRSLKKEIRVVEEVLDRKKTAVQELEGKIIDLEEIILRKEGMHRTELGELGAVYKEENEGEGWQTLYAGR
jgi:hypothetical protein